MGRGGLLLLSQKPEKPPLSWAKSIQTILLLPRLRIPLSYFIPIHASLFKVISLSSPHPNAAYTIPFPSTCYMPHTFHSSLFIRPNNIWWELHITEILVFQSSPLSGYFVLMRHKYLPQSSFSQKPWAYVPPSVSETKFRTHAKQLEKLSNRIRDL